MITHPNDRRDEMPVHRNKAPRFRDEAKITHGVIHMTGVEGKNADQHARYHTRAKDWPTVAYTSYIGTDGRRELLLDYEVVGFHAGNFNNRSIGVVVEGDFNKRGLTPFIIDALVDECIYHDTALGRRLVWTFHNEVMEDRKCPGDMFPKKLVLEEIERRYKVSEPPKEEPPVVDEPTVKEPPIVTPEEPEANNSDRWKWLEGKEWLAFVIAMTLIALLLALSMPYS